MRGIRAVADDSRVQARGLLVVLVGAVTVAALAGASPKAAGGRPCTVDANQGYSYAGHQATTRAHGVRATITMTREPSVRAGHVAGWVGVGGPGQGANGVDAWIQSGIASMPGENPFIYAEITRGNRPPHFILVEEDVVLARPHAFAVLEMSGRPGWWRVWIDGRAVTDPVRMPDSSGRWAPIATAENWNAATVSCNSFGFRFARLSVSHGGGGSWRPFIPGHRFLDGGNALRELATAHAFVASSGW